MSNLRTLISRLKKRIRFAIPGRPLSELLQENEDEEVCTQNNERNDPAAIDNETEESNQYDEAANLI